MPSICLQEFADAFGVTLDNLPDACISAYVRYMGDLSFDIIDGRQRDKVITDILKHIDADTQKIGAPERTVVWQEGWKENLDAFRSERNIESLRPKYYRPMNIMRWKGSFIQPHSPNFEMAYLAVFQKWLFSYFQPYDNVYEFGCGSGINLCEIARMYPEKRVFGSDFVPASVEIANELGKHYDNKITGFQFNMLEPDYERDILPNSVILTSGALEQLASKIQPFFDYLLDKKPALCVFAEPVIEVYNDESLLDVLAMKFHRKRGYTEGIIPWLRKKQDEGKLEILKIQRQYIGSKFFEGWTIIIWKPL